MRIEVDWDLCESNALCMAAAPEVFVVDDNDRLEVLNDTPDARLWPDVQRAVRVCPKQALRILD